MAPSQTLPDGAPAPPELQKVVKPCSVTAQDANEDVEICIFRIPRGLLDASDLLNCKIKLGGKKNSKINIKGKDFEIVTKPLQDGTPVLPWFPDSNGSLHPVTPELSEITEVNVRRCLESESLPAASEEDLAYLKPVKHSPPDLPRRDFFSGYNCVFAQPEIPKKKKSPKQTPKSSVIESRKNRLSLEEITPQDEQMRPSKKKKGDPLAANFKNIFNDICKSPKDDVVSDYGVTPPKKSKKKLKDRDTSSKIKQEQLNHEEDLNQSVLHSGSEEIPEGDTQNKRVKLEVNDSQLDLSSSLPSNSKKNKKKKR